MSFLKTLAILVALISPAVAAPESAPSAPQIPILEANSAAPSTYGSDTSPSSKISFIQSRTLGAPKSSFQNGFVVGVPVSTMNPMALELKSNIETPEKIRDFLHLNQDEDNYLYMRFGLSPLERVNGFKKRVVASNLFYRIPEKRYGPSLGMSFGLNKTMSLEAEYQPEFGIKHKTEIAQTSSRFTNALRRIDRMDTFRVRFNLKFDSQK